MFKEIEKSIGHVKIGKSQTIYFEYDSLGTVIEATSPCDCSIPVNDASNKRIRVEYTPKAVPIHLKKAGHTEYAIRKPITIKWTNEQGIETITELIFKGVVHE